MSTIFSNCFNCYPKENFPCIHDQFSFLFGGEVLRQARPCTILSCIDVSFKGLTLGMQSRRLVFFPHSFPSPPPINRDNHVV